MYAGRKAFWNTIRVFVIKIIQILYIDWSVISYNPLWAKVHHFLLILYPFAEWDVCKESRLSGEVNEYPSATNFNTLLEYLVWFLCIWHFRLLFCGSCISTVLVLTAWVFVTQSRKNEHMKVAAKDCRSIGIWRNKIMWWSKLILLKPSYQFHASTHAFSWMWNS